MSPVRFLVAPHRKKMGCNCFATHFYLRLTHIFCGSTQNKHGFEALYIIELPTKRYICNVFYIAMKRLPLFAIMLMLLATTVSAQYRPQKILNKPNYDINRRWHFGFSVGLNFMDFDVRNSTETQIDDEGNVYRYFANINKVSPGFNVNAICNLRLTELLHLRFTPGYALSQRDLHFYSINPAEGATPHSTMKIESSFVEIPLGLKLASKRHSNVRPYLYAGGNYRIDIAAFKRMKVEDGVMIRLVKHDAYYEVGVGIDFFLPYFKFSTELLWSAGLLNAISDDYADGAAPFRNSIEHLRSRIVCIKFHFE